MQRVTLSVADVLVVICYFAGLLLIGFRAARRTGEGAEQYILAGRRLTLPAFVATLVATWYGGILGVGEFSYRYGLSSWIVMGLPYYIFAALFAFFLAHLIRRGNTLTIPDRLYEHYGRGAGALGSLLVFVITSPAAYVLMLGIFIQLLFGWGLAAAIIAGAALSFVYVYAGGFRAVVVTDKLQFILMFAGFACIIPFAAAEAGGLDFLSGTLPPDHLTLSGGNTTGYIIAWFFIALWTMIDPSFHQRCSAAATPAIARKGVLISIGFWALFDMMTTTAGLYARAMLPDIEPLHAYPLLAEAVLPPALKGLFFVSLLATIMSTVDSLSLISAATIGRDFLWRLRGGSDARIALYTRCGMAVTVVLSISIAFFLPSVIKIWYSLGTLIIPALLLPVVTSYFPRWRVSGTGALLVMLGGLIASSAWLTSGAGRVGDGATSYPFGIEPIYAGLTTALLIHLIFLTKKKQFI